MWIGYDNTLKLTTAAGFLSQVSYTCFHFTNYSHLSRLYFGSLVLILSFFPSERDRRPMAEMEDRRPRIATCVKHARVLGQQKWRKNFDEHDDSNLSREKVTLFFTAEFSHFLIANFFSRKWSLQIFSIFLHSKMH